MADNNNANPAEVVAVTVNEEIKKAKEDEGAKQNRIRLGRKCFKVQHMISGLIAVAAFVISLPILASVTWLLYMKSYECEWLFELSSLQIGISVGLMSVFVICNAALFVRTRLPMVGIIMVMVPLTVMLTVGLALLGASDMESRRIPATPMWFKMKIHDKSLWTNTKQCIYDSGACQDLASASMDLKSYDFNMKKLSSIQNGCCKPPKVCQMEYVNAMYWQKDDKVVNGSSNLPHNADCDSWQNHGEILCYDCNSCKEGYISTLKSKWSKLGEFIVCMAVLLMCSHFLLFLVTMWEIYVILDQS